VGTAGMMKTGLTEETDELLLPLLFAAAIFIRLRSRHVRVKYEICESALIHDKKARKRRRI
jgi:hypothetical protein